MKRWPRQTWSGNLVGLLADLLSDSPYRLRTERMAVCAAVLWELWVDRNKLIFQGNSKSAALLVSSAIVKAEEFLFVEEQSGPRGFSRSIPGLFINSFWKPLQPSTLKVNFDGAWSLSAGIGFAIRNHQGDQGWNSKGGSFLSSYC